MKILLFITHPDDETMCASLILEACKRGAEAHICTATRGEGGRCGAPPVACRDNLGRVRENEMKAAGFVLGLSSITFYGAIDPVSTSMADLHAPAIDYPDYREMAHRLMRELQPDVIVSHGARGEYGHPGHILIGEITRRAWQDFPEPKPAFYTFAAQDPEAAGMMTQNEERASFFVATAGWADKRLEHFLCHFSQPWPEDDTPNTSPAYTAKVAELVAQKRREAYSLRSGGSDILREFLGICK